MGKKLRPGKGAKASVLTRMIKPPQPIQAKDQRSDITLVEQFTNEKGKVCYRFRCTMDAEDGDSGLSCLAHWVRILQEGDQQDLFDPIQRMQKHSDDKFIEPKIKWTDSKAKRILCKDVMNGLVPRFARDEQNKSTMPLKDICNMHPDEYHHYDYNKFSSRLSGIRKSIEKKTDRATADQIAFDLYVANHNVSLFSAKGYIQWQGSDVQHYFGRTALILVDHV